MQTYLEIQCDTIRWEQFLRRCRLGQLKQDISRRRQHLKTKYEKSKYVRYIIMMILIFYNIIRNAY